jgi:hypothetical protein
LPAALASCLLGLFTLTACGGSDQRTTATVHRTDGSPSKAITHDSVVRVDAASGRVEAVIPVGDDGSVWISLE